MTTRSHVPTRRGFTLIEMVISTALMALILGGGYACLRSGIQSQALVDSRTEAFQNARVALKLLSADLRNACPLSDKYEFLGMNRELGTAEADNLDFGTRNYAPQQPGEADFCEVSYYLRKAEKAPGRLDLYRRRDPSRDDEPLAGGTEELLVEGVQALRLEYYDGFEWFDEWGDPEGKHKNSPNLAGRSNLAGLPEAVRITLSLAVGKVAKPSDPQGEPPKPDAEPPFLVQTVAKLNIPPRASSANSSGSGSSSAPRPATGGAR